MSMADEAAFLRAIQADLTDATAKEPKSPTHYLPTRGQLSR
jgi:hypothetical protein